MDIRSACAAEHKVSRKADNMVESSIKQFEEHTDFGKQALQAAEAAFPSLADFQGSFLPKPSSSHLPTSLLHHFQWQPTSALRVAQSALSASGSTKAGQLLGSNLLSTWSALHETVSSAPAEALTVNEKAHNCYMAGLCMCKEGAPDHLLKVKAKLNSAIKMFAKTSKSNSDALSASKVVALFASFKQEDCADGQAVPLDVIPSQCLWLHVGFQSFSPFKSSWHVLLGLRSLFQT